MPETDPHGTDAHAPGAKLDSGKPEYTMALRSFPRALAQVNAIGVFGAKKYSLDGWKTVPDGEQRYTEAMLRHIIAEFGDEVRDPATGLFHAAQTAWNALARLELQLKDDPLAADEKIQDTDPYTIARETLKLQRAALEEIRDVAAVSEGVDFYKMLAERGLNHVKS